VRAKPRRAVPCHAYPGLSRPRLSSSRSRSACEIGILITLTAFVLLRRGAARCSRWFRKI